jgi:hypothetical protein
VVVSDQEREAANREFAQGFNGGLRGEMGQDWYGDWLKENSKR